MKKGSGNKINKRKYEFEPRPEKSHSSPQNPKKGGSPKFNPQSSLNNTLKDLSKELKKRTEKQREPEQALITYTAQNSNGETREWDTIPITEADTEQDLPTSKPEVIAHMWTMLE